MDRTGRLMFKLVLLAFALMFAAVMRVNSSFNTIVQPQVAPELIHTAELKRELLRYGDQAGVIALEQVGVLKGKVLAVGKQVQQVQEQAQLGRKKVEPLEEKVLLAREKAWDWWCRVWQDKWENIAAKKQEKGRD